MLGTKATKIASRERDKELGCNMVPMMVGAKVNPLLIHVSIIRSVGMGSPSMNHLMADKA
jgi:hypothetical protein